jgi:hypothetical protein
LKLIELCLNAEDLMLCAGCFVSSVDILFMLIDMVLVSSVTCGKCASLPFESYGSTLTVVHHTADWVLGRHALQGRCARDHQLPPGNAGLRRSHCSRYVCYRVMLLLLQCHVNNLAVFSVIKGLKRLIELSIEPK